MSNIYHSIGNHVHSPKDQNQALSEVDESRLGICSRCGKSVLLSQAFQDGNEIICQDCFSRCELITCTECGRVMSKKEARCYYGVPFCSRCLEREKGGKGLRIEI